MNTLLNTLLLDEVRFVGSYDDGHTPSGGTILFAICAIIMFVVVMKSFFSTTDKHGAGGCLIAIVGLLAVAAVIVGAVYVISTAI